MTEDIVNRMLIGFERCHVCGWKNIFWEGEEPLPQLIAHLDAGPPFVCPKCRSDRTQRWQIRPTPAEFFFTEAELVGEGRPNNQSQDSPKRYPMTWRNHLKAFIRCFLPWDEFSKTTFEFVGITSILVIIVASLITWHFGIVYQSLISFYIFLALMVFCCHCVIALLLLVNNDFEGLVDIWQKIGQEPLFGNTRQHIAFSREWRQQAKRLRGLGMSRLQARVMAKASKACISVLQEQLDPEKQS